MLVRSSFCAAEIDVFHALTKWIHAQHFTEVALALSVHPFKQHFCRFSSQSIWPRWLEGSSRRTVFDFIWWVRMNSWPPSEDPRFSQQTPAYLTSTSWVQFGKETAAALAWDIVDPYVSLCAFQSQTSTSSLNFRLTVYDQNVATAELGAVFLVGGNPNMLLSAGGSQSFLPRCVLTNCEEPPLFRDEQLQTQPSAGTQKRRCGEQRRNRTSTRPTIHD